MTNAFYVCSECNKHIRKDDYTIVEWEKEVADFYISDITSEAAVALVKTLAADRGEPEPTFTKHLFHSGKRLILQRNYMKYLCGPLQEPNDMDEYLEWLDTHVHRSK